MMENKQFTKSQSINHQPQENIRSRAKQRSYIFGGLKKLFANPWKGVVVLLLSIIAFLAAWKAADTYIPNMTTIPLLLSALTYAGRILIPTVILLLLAALLWLLGAPHKAQEIENDVAAALGIARTSPLSYRRPFLISRMPIKGTTAAEYVFWSRWIDLDQWNKLETRKAVLWALNAHSDDNFTYGKKKYTVSIRAGSGSKPEERETPQDPLFK